MMHCSICGDLISSKTKGDLCKKCYREVKKYSKSCLADDDQAVENEHFSWNHLDTFEADRKTHNERFYDSHN